MGANTAKGYPYPVGTDRVMDGDNAIQALAVKVNDQLGAMAAGVVSVVTTGTGPSNGAVAVTFPAGRFTVAPRIGLTQGSGIPAAATDYSTPWPSTITAASFNVNVRRNDPATCTVHWIATTVDQ